MTLNDILNTSLTDSQKIEFIKLLLKGGSAVEKELNSTVSEETENDLELQENKDNNLFHVEGNDDFNNFIKTLPSNQATYTPDFDMYRYWELNGKPKNFLEAIKRNMFVLLQDGWHANSIAYNPETDEYEWMKKSDHRTAPLEFLDYLHNSEFREDDGYTIESDPDRKGFLKYVKKSNSITKHQHGGNLTPEQLRGAAPIHKDGHDYYLNGDGLLTPAEHFKDHPEERGKQFGNSKILHPTEIITVGGNEYLVEVAKTPLEKRDGLSRVNKLAKDEGMLFVYDLPASDYYTMTDTNIDLDIIFIDSEGIVLEVHSVEAHDPEPVVCKLPYLYVLEVSIDSNIKEGDELEQEDNELTDEEKMLVSKSKMLVLNSEGDVQMKLVGGERIVSMIKTRQLIKAALKAYRTDNDSDYSRVGKLIFNELDAQDGRKPQYVSK